MHVYIISTFSLNYIHVYTYSVMFVFSLYIECVTTEKLIEDREKCRFIYIQFYNKSDPCNHYL